MSSYSILPLVPIFIVLFSVAALVLITLGVRGRPVFSSPRCGKCGYDLRNVQFMAQESVGNCPECGASLADATAVSFGKYQRQPRRIVFGIVLLILPWVLAAGLAFYVRSSAVAVRAGATLSPQARASLATPALLASLKTTLNEPWTWQELERRMQRGELSQEDVDAAFGLLIADLNAKRAAGKRPEPLHWADRFIKPAIAGGRVSPERIVALAQSFYGPDPKIVMRDRQREGEPILLSLNEFQPWNLPGMKQVWALSSVTIDGAPVRPQARYPNFVQQGEQPPPLTPDQLSGSSSDAPAISLPHALAPGEHELVLTHEMGVVADSATMRGLDGKPGTPDKWPAPFARWQSVVKRKVTVVAKDKPVLTVITDPASNPFTSASLYVQEALARPSSRGVDLVVKFKPTGTFTPVLSYRIVLETGDGEKIDYGTLVIGRIGTHSYESYSGRKTINALDPRVKQVNVILEVNEKAAEGYLDIKEVWGGRHRIDGVKLERFDLADKGTAHGTSGAEAQAPAPQTR